MRILLAGVTGQVGAALFSHLSQAATVISPDRAVLDLAQPDTIGPVLDRSAPDLIINAAAYTAVDKAEDEPDLAMRTNAESPAVMAQWAADCGVPFIHFSTDYVYDGGGSRAWHEEDDARPLSVYGRSKLAGDNAIRACAGSFLIVRTSWVYSARGRNFMCTILRLARENKELRIVNDQIGAPTSVAVIADVTARILTGGIEHVRDQCKKSHGLIHVAGSGTTTWYVFACAIVQGLRSRGVELLVENIVPIDTAEYPTRAKRPLNSRLNMERLETTLGVVPPHWELTLGRELDQLVRNIESERQSAA